MILAGVGTTTFVEVGVVLVIAVFVLIGVAAYLGWLNTHKMFRREQKEDRREARKRK